MKIVSLPPRKFYRIARKRRSFAPRKRLLRRPKPKGTKKTPSLRMADIAFSDYIRKRDGRCLFPGCTVTDYKKLQCSHYFGRAVKSTRFAPNNCISLCWFHHFKSKDLGFEYQKQTVAKHGYDGQYTLWMKNWLGEKGWFNLVLMSNLSIKQKTAIENCMAFLNAKSS